MPAVEVISTPSLGDRSYVVADGGAAVVVDPQRDVDRVLAVAGQFGARITAVLETHLPHDYLSGGLELSRLTGAPYWVPAGSGVSFDHHPVAEGEVLPLGLRSGLRAVATPGHAFNHHAYVLEEGDRAVGVFTGGSLLFGTTGRADLVGPEHSEELAREQHESAHKLARLLPDDAQLWPTHVTGDFCLASRSVGQQGTIGQQKKVNPVFSLSADAFVEHLLSGVGPVPGYFQRLVEDNRVGPPPVSLQVEEPVGPAELARRLAAGYLVVDVRDRQRYARSHLAGTVSFGLDNSLVPWLGWLVDPGEPVTVVAEDEQQVAAARRELVRIGVDHAVAVGTPQELATGLNALRSLPVARFADLGQADVEVVLDVRGRREWRQQHVRGAVHVPLWELPRRLSQIPDGTVWVHCSGGNRAVTAASLLARHGREVVAVDDSIAAAQTAGLALASDV